MALIGSDKRRVIVGLGATGLSCARYLAAQGLAFEVIDSRTNPPGLADFQQEFPDTRLNLGSFDHNLLLDADDIILSPGVAPQEAAVANAKARGAAVYGDIELFARAVAKPVVAITGSNGKSTVTSLVGELARHAGIAVAVGGNLGTPALDLLRQRDAELFVLELSSFQLEVTESLRPEVATVLNMSADHIDRHGSMMTYHQIKHRIFRGARHVVVNRDDPLSQPLVANDMTLWPFSINGTQPNQFGAQLDQGRRWLCWGFDKLIALDELQLQGSHNLSNLLAALSIGKALDLPMAAMLQAVREFKGLPHRCEKVAEYKGVLYINDSKGTNVGAACAAIQGLGEQITGKVIWLGGGQGKGADFSPLAEVLQRFAKQALLFGEDATAIEQAVAGAVITQHCGDMASALTLAADLAKPGDAVVLSPACASFDQFADYQARGRAFVEEVTRRLC